MVDESSGEVFTLAHTFVQISSGTWFLAKYPYLSVDLAATNGTWLGRTSACGLPPRRCPRAPSRPAQALRCGQPPRSTARRLEGGRGYQRLGGGGLGGFRSSLMDAWPCWRFTEPSRGQTRRCDHPPSPARGPLTKPTKAALLHACGRAESSHAPAGSAAMAWTLPTDGPWPAALSATPDDDEPAAPLPGSSTRHGSTAAA